MILGKERRRVIENIRLCAESGRFHHKVEEGDPVLSREEAKEITDRYLEFRGTLGYRLRSAAAMGIASLATKRLNRNTEIRGMERIPVGLGGVLITSNHFDPLENTVIRHLIRCMGRKRLGIISQVSNFAMTGAIGFFMNYADTIPLSADSHYLARDFLSVLKERLVEKGDAILLYPEQEMWFRYRKPRPPQSGAYYFGSKLKVPILSCFVEMLECPEEEDGEFFKLKYVLHVLGVLTPDPEKSVKYNTEMLAARDFALKKECYEACYGKKLSYEFEPWDIAGWKES